MAESNLAFVGLFRPIQFLFRFCRFKDDFGRFLYTVTGHRMISLYWKLCTRIL